MRDVESRGDKWGGGAAVHVTHWEKSVCKSGEAQDTTYLGHSPNGNHGKSERSLHSQEFVAGLRAREVITRSSTEEF